MAAAAHPETGQVLGGATHNERCRDRCGVSWRAGRQIPAGSPVPAGRACGPCPPLAPYSSGAHSWQDSSPPTAPHPDLPWWEQSGAVSEADAPPLVKPRLQTRGPAPRAPVLGDLGKRPWQSSRGSPWRRLGSLQKERASQPRGHLFFAVFTLKRLRLRRRHCLPPRPTVRGAGWSPHPTRFQPAAVQAEFAASGPACWARKPGLPGTSGASDKCLMVRVLLLPFLPGIQVLRGGDPL